MERLLVRNPLTSMKTYEEKVQMVLDDYWSGKISQIRADEMLRVIQQQHKISGTLDLRTLERRENERTGEN